MNWMKAIRRLLGRFWTRVVDDQDFILLVEKLVGMLSGIETQGLEAWHAGRALRLRGEHRGRLPYMVLLRRDAAHPALSLLEVLQGAPAGALDETGGWVLRSRYPLPVPCMLTDHVVGATVSLFSGVDFDVYGPAALLFHVDPEELGLESELLDDGEGGVAEYYRVFGWASYEDAVEDAVAAFESPDLTSCAEEAWDVHQNGATELGARRLLATAAGTVVCLQDGAVDEMWTEGDLHCMTVGDRLYSSELEPAAGLGIGAVVRAGDVLFGDLVFASDISDSCLDDRARIPGVYVMTDAGELYADNSDSMSAPVLPCGLACLPLTRDGSVPQEYLDKCNDLGNAGAPVVGVPAKVNPCRFVLDTLRAGNFFLASLSVPPLAQSVRKVAAAIACLRRSAAAGGSVGVYIKASGEAADVRMGAVTVHAVRAAVSAPVSLTIKSVACNGRIFI